MQSALLLGKTSFPAHTCLVSAISIFWRVLRSVGQGFFGSQIQSGLFAFHVRKELLFDGTDADRWGTRVLVGGSHKIEPTDTCHVRYRL